MGLGFWKWTAGFENPEQSGKKNYDTWFNDNHLRYEPLMIIDSVLSWNYINVM
jgi:hypothetical protein